MRVRIDLVYFADGDEPVQWEYGEKIEASDVLPVYKKQVDTLVSSTSAQWVLFWDYSLGSPGTTLIEQLAQQPVDVFHAGLKLGTRGLPDVLNYVHPTWMYNIDGDINTTHTNFRLSLRACMIRVEVLRKTGSLSDDYFSITMAGVALGYNILKQGGIIRYYAGMVKNDNTCTLYIPARDEWVFAKQFFTNKWLFWTLLNKPGFLSNLKAWVSARHVKYINPVPCLHPSVKTNVIAKPATVSVLAPTLDRYPYLEEELRELNLQTIPPHEVLITDQTDKERRQQIDFTPYPNIKVKYFTQEEKGQCLAWNKLIEESTGEYIFFFGDDAYDIKPDLIEKMLQTMYRFDADMVASNVREKGITYGTINHHYYLSDTFPITLIKKAMVEQAGGMDMFFNRNVKADHDLAMRCHLNGALMIFDPSAEIGHHRAPSGGLRAHNARVITNFMTKNTVTKILNPSASEIFIYNKYYTHRQFINHVKIKYMNQVIINGNILKKIARLFVLLYRIPSMRKVYRANYLVTMEEFKKRRMQVRK